MWSEMTIGARRLGGRRRNRRRAEYAAGRARAFLIHSVAVRHARDVARVIGAGRAVGEDNRRRARARLVRGDAINRPADAPRQLQILWHDRHALGVDRTQITIFKKMH